MNYIIKFLFKIIIIKLIILYVSKINKNQKDITKLLQKHMKSIKFNYQEEKSDINYEEYFFNGINSTNDFGDIKIDKTNNINIDNNKIKYKVEIRKENEEFIQAYEGNDLNCKIIIYFL